jgi:uncharacterized repeat protein (TIGR03803 family)
LQAVPRRRLSTEALYRFTGGKDGSDPQAGLVFDQAGNLYGTTLFGGAQDQGTVFQFTPNQNGGWTESVLYSFCSLGNCADGAKPYAGVIFDQAGNLYGTTSTGGDPKCGCGTVFELTPNQNGGWTESVLHKFCLPSNCGAGSNPFAGLVFDQAGNLYGTTALGGANPTPYGVIFKMTPKTGGGWTYQKLHTFLDRPGARPAASLILDKAGNLYGTTTGDSIKTFGSVFEITP